MHNGKIIVGLDIGTTKVCAIVGRFNEYGKIDVLGMGKADSHGVTRGVVTNINKTVEAIRKAIDEASDKSGVEIRKVHVGIAGQHIKSRQHRGLVVRNSIDTEIDFSDLGKLEGDMYKLALNPGEEIIHVLPQEYTVDNEPGIKDPVGMSGIRLEGNFHVITAQVTAARNIYKCVQLANLEAADLILEPLASSESVLSPQEMDAGVALVDIGGGTTDIAIFHDGIIRHTAVIPYGGNIITEDIKEGCNVLRDHAELLKVKFGSALWEETKPNEIISIPGLRGRDPKEISVRNLAKIIQARVEEIFELVYCEIKNSGVEKKLIGGVVITGGGAQLKHVTQLAEYVTGLDARIGLPNEHLAKGMVEEVKSPMYATGIGLVIKGLKTEEKDSGNSTAVKTDSDIKEHRKLVKDEIQRKNFLNRLKQWFVDDLDVKDF
ncbi:MAG TPA: cell division protein FtsA [Bacteroidia bacterium]|nr:cell division protein FtsA [Bacteroidia bacterium]